MSSFYAKKLDITIKIPGEIFPYRGFCLFLHLVSPADAACFGGFPNVTR
jgi:hypothetical protein